jgi:ADP-ribosylglycohydrolase
MRLEAASERRAAALNLSRRGVNWFSNFFESGQQRYVNTGGNGAAMRVQPHVWASRGETDELLLNVLRDALVTHGHAQGFCGAVFHALILEQTLKNATIPMVDSWVRAAERFVDIPNLSKRDVTAAGAMRRWPANRLRSISRGAVRRSWCWGDRLCG